MSGHPVGRSTECSLSGLGIHPGDHSGDYEFGTELLIMQSPGCNVRKAKHTPTGDIVAVKRHSLASKQGEDLKRKLRRAAVIHSTLHHPNVCKLRESFMTADSLWLVMDFCKQPSLFDCIERGFPLHHPAYSSCNPRGVRHVLESPRVPAPVAHGIFTSIANAVAYLHRRDVFHRDISLSNLMLHLNDEKPRRWTVKLIDFSSAGVGPRWADKVAESNPGTDPDWLRELVGTQPSPLTFAMRTSVGTHEYTAPEVLGRSEYQGGPVDVWSLGVVLYKLVCGYFPFPAGDRRVLRILSNHRAPLPDGIPKSLENLLDWMLHPVPDRRATMVDVLGHAWTCFGADGEPDAPTSMLSTSVPSVLPSCHRLSTGKKARRSKKRRKQSRRSRKHLQKLKHMSSMESSSSDASAADAAGAGAGGAGTGGGAGAGAAVAAGGARSGTAPKEGGVLDRPEREGMPMILDDPTRPHPRERVRARLRNMRSGRRSRPRGYRLGTPARLASGYVSDSSQSSVGSSMSAYTTMGYGASRRSRGGAGTGGSKARRRSAASGGVVSDDGSSVYSYGSSSVASWTSASSADGDDMVIRGTRVPHAAAAAADESEDEGKGDDVEVVVLSDHASTSIHGDGPGGAVSGPAVVTVPPAPVFHGMMPSRASRGPSVPLKHACDGLGDAVPGVSPRLVGAGGMAGAGRYGAARRRVDSVRPARTILRASILAGGGVEEVKESKVGAPDVAAAAESEDEAKEVHEEKEGTKRKTKRKKSRKKRKKKTTTTQKGRGSKRSGKSKSGASSIDGDSDSDVDGSGRGSNGGRRKAAEAAGGRAPARKPTLRRVLMSSWGSPGGPPVPWW